MCLKTRLLLSVALLSAPALPAVAADYDPPIFVEEMAPWVPVEIGSGWYLRGDVTYTFKTRALGPFDYRTYQGGGVYGSETYDRASIGEDFSFGGGVGYHFTDMLRMDVTLDHGRLRFGGYDLRDDLCADDADTVCHIESTSMVSAWSGLVNAYVDLGTVSGFTPYVGAGLGYTYLSSKGMRSDLYCDDPGADSCAFSHIGPITNPGSHDWRFTWAAMAGVAWDATKNVKVDLGYRYRRISGGNMYRFTSDEQAFGASGTVGRDKGIDQHQVRVGLRYSLW